MFKSSGSAATAELAFANQKVIEVTAPDDSKSYVAPLQLYGCDEVIWLEWRDRDDSPRDVPFYDRVCNLIDTYETSLVEYEKTRFQHPPLH